jgi:hypothetical protein
MKAAAIVAGVAGSVMTFAEDGQGPLSYRLASREGRQVIECSDGRLIPWACYSSCSERSFETWQQKQRGFLEAGVHLYQIGIWRWPGEFWRNPFFSLDGKPVIEPNGPINLNEQAEWLIEQDPEAVFLVRFSVQPDPRWREQCIDQFPVIGMGADEEPAHAVNASLASDTYIEGIDRLIRDTVAWSERQSWRGRIAGYTIYPYGEGFTELSITGELFEVSAPMTEKFRAFVGRTYDSDEALREAWDDPDVTREGVTVPSMDAWTRKRERLGLMHWPEPSRVGRERDYFLLQRELFVRYCRTLFTALGEATADRPVVKGYDILKQGIQGWMHDAGFFGAWEPDMMDRAGSMHMASGTFDTATLLDDPGLDVLVTPAMYFNRAMGYGWEPEGLTDSLTLRGKANLTEADMRTWVNRDWEGREQSTPMPDAGVFLNAVEMSAGFDRTLATALSRNQMFYYMSVCGANWWFDDPVITNRIRDQRALIEASVGWPWQETTDAVCLVVDDAAGLYEDFSSGFQHLAVFRQIMEGLALCGLPYRIHLLCDLVRDDFPDYRCFLFPNLFRVDEPVLAMLRKQVFRDGKVAIFGPGTGITNGRELSAAGAEQVLGVPMELVDKSCSRRTIFQDHGHPISRNLETATFGDSHAFGPLLVPSVQRFDASHRAVSLGSTFLYYELDRPGLFVVDHGRGGAANEPSGVRGEDDYAVVFSAAVPLPPALLRECARYAGCHIWSEENAVISASSDFVGLHTTKSGEHVIHLPRVCNVLDPHTGEVLDAATDTIRLDLSAPATRLFRLR